MRLGANGRAQAAAPGFRGNHSKNASKGPLDALRLPPARRASETALVIPTKTTGRDVRDAYAPAEYSPDQEASSQANFQNLMQLLENWGIPDAEQGVVAVRREIKAIQPRYLEKPDADVLAIVSAMITEQALRLNKQKEVDPEHPMGKLAYHSQLRREGIDMPPKALHALLAREVAILESKLAALGKQIDPGRSWRDIALQLPQDQLDSKEQVFSAYKKAVRQAKAFVQAKGLMDLPETDAEVVQSPVEAPRNIPFSVCPGTYYYPLRQFELNWHDDPKAKSTMLGVHHKARIPVLAVHEVFPGHHAAMSASRGNGYSRVVADNAFFAEGWATYAEKLMLAHGFFKKPEEQFYLLRHHWNQANTALNNLQIHSKDPAWEVSDSRSLREKDRHLMRGADLAAYYLGMLQIERLKAAVQAEHPRMTDREFHNRLIHCPEMPLTIMAKVAFGIDLPPLKDEDSLMGAGAASYPDAYIPDSATSDSSVAKFGKGPRAKTSSRISQAFSLPQFFSAE